MFNKIRNYFVSRKEYSEAKKAVTLMLLNQYSELLDAQNKLVTEQLKVNEVLTNFNNSVSPEELKAFMSDISKFSSNPNLSSEYLSQVSKQAHEQKMAELKASK